MAIRASTLVSNQSLLISESFGENWLFEIGLKGFSG
jgi:hypothetical protein